MSLQIWMGCAGSGKTYQLNKHIINEAKNHPEYTYLYVVPEQFTLQTQYDLVNMSENKGILNVDVLSFARLSHRVFEEVGYAYASGILLDDMGKSLVLRRLASLYADELPYFGRHLKKLGYISEVKSVISEFMQYGVGDDEIARMIEGAENSGKGMLKSKLGDIRTIFRAFREYTNEKYITSEEILTRVSHVIPQSEKIKKSIIIFDGFTGFTPVQYQVIGALLENCVDVYVTLTMDVRALAKVTGNDKGRAAENTDVIDEQELFYLSKKTRKDLNKLAEELNINKKADVIINDEIPIRYRYRADSQKNNIMIRHLERNIFRENQGVMTGNSIRLISAINPYEEMKLVAVNISKLVREEGYRYKDIAVVSGDTDTYMHEAARAFDLYDIPFFVDRTQPVLLNPFVEFIRNLLKIISDDYSYEAVFGYLKSGLTDITPDECDRLENYVLATGIHGHSQWNKRFTRCPAGMEQEELQIIDAIRERVATDLEEFYSEVSSYIQKDSKTKEIAVKDYTMALYSVLVRFDIQRKLLNYACDFKQKSDYVRAKEYEQIYGEIMNLFDKLVELLDDTRVSIDEYAELIDAGFAEIRVGLIPKSIDYVQIGDITRSRLRDVKAIFFVGVNDGIVPATGGKGGILTDMDREYFASSGLDVELAPSSRLQAYTERLYLYMLMSKCEERLYISFSRLSGEGKSLRPSYLINVIKHMFPSIDIERGEDVPLSERIYGEKAAFMEVACGMQDYIERGGAGEGDSDTDTDAAVAVVADTDADAEIYRQLLRFFATSDKYEQPLENLIDMAFSMDAFKSSDAISKAVAGILYGKRLTASVTRLESYARCAYRHFLKYGLSLKERTLFDFSPRDMGNVFHDSLQKYSEIMREKGENWFTIDKEKSDEYVSEAVERCVASGAYDVIYSSFRSTYMMERIKRITGRTVSVLTSQIRKGSFEPADFELNFSSVNDCRALNFTLSDDEKMRLVGRIDRLDVKEDDKKCYVKIIDYKSGDKNFDLAAVYEGCELQLVVYLNAAMEIVGKRNGGGIGSPDGATGGNAAGVMTGNSDGTTETDTGLNAGDVIPAGILYYHIDDPLIETSGNETDEEINEKIRRKLVMKGLVNSDDKIIEMMDKNFSGASEVIPVRRKADGSLYDTSCAATSEEFKVISEYVNMKIQEMGGQILDGRIECTSGKCDYCEYGSICRYKETGVIKKEIPKMKKDEAIAAMKKAVVKG